MRVNGETMSLMSKFPLTITAIVALILGVVLLLNSGQDESSSKDSTDDRSTKVASSSKNVPPYAVSGSSINLDTLAREVSPEVPRVTNEAGHTIIASADTSDEEKTDELLKSFARGKAHLQHMRRENAFVTRRQIVELSESFAEIGDQILNGEEIETFEIPDFDGETFTMVYDPTIMGPESNENGTLIGSVDGEEVSDVILGYYEGFTSAYVNLPLQNRVLEYMTVGGNQIVVKEIDLDARNIAEPCLRCHPDAEGHSAHPEGLAHDLDRNSSSDL